METVVGGVATVARIWSQELPQHVGEQVEVAGWLHNQRRLARVTFALVRDARGITQVVVEDEVNRKELATWPDESVVRVSGTVAAVAQAPGGLEIHDPAFELISLAAADPPVELRRPALDVQLPTLLDNAPITWRHPRQRAFASIAATSTSGFRDTLAALGFTEIHTPKLVGSTTEGGANVFRVDYFGRDAYLAQSPQLYKQVMVGVFERVYEVGPAFRAEPHGTGRHLAEFVSLDAEIGFIDDHRDVMGVLREAVAGMVEAVRDRAAVAVGLLDIKLPRVPDEIPVLDFVVAQELASRLTGEDATGEPDLAPAHERALGEWVSAEHGSDFIYVVGYPSAKRPFYTHPDPHREGYTNSFDLIFRGVELVSGGQRLHREEDYLRALEGQDLEPFAGYLQAFRFGMPPHGGFAIGLERFVARLTARPNVREVTLFPRDLSRLAP
jgi:nondiscriminating aspartyl-tRNA synthetase